MRANPRIKSKVESRESRQGRGSPRRAAKVESPARGEARPEGRRKSKAWRGPASHRRAYASRGWPASLGRAWRVEAGQSLIEVVVALGVVIMLAVSLVATTLFVQRASEGARNNTQATKLVQQNIEQIRIFRDRNASGFEALPGSGCYTLSTTNPNPAGWTLNALSSCLPTPPAGSEAIILNNTTFSRWLAFASESSTNKTVVVTVSWKDSGGVQQVTNSTFLSKPCTGQIGAGGGASPCP